MPNTLAHIGFNGVITKSVLKQPDLILIYIGSIIPDLRWIIQRLVFFVKPSIDLYDLRLYCIVLATFSFSIIFSTALSNIFDNSKRAFAIFSFGSLLHLVLDSLEIKWANGVHFFAPLNWEIFNAGLFWPENPIIYLLTFCGVLFLLINWKKSLLVQMKFSFSNLSKILAVSSFLIIYFLFPIYFMDDVENADNHFVKTLRNSEIRTGSYFEIDRGNLVDENGHYNFVTPFNEVLKITNYNFQSSEIMSIKAKFISGNEIQILDYHIHSDRDIYSYIGLLLIGVIFILEMINNWRTKRVPAKIDI